MVTFTKDELALLREIVNDKFSSGAFSGMVFNGLIQYKTNSKDESLGLDTAELIDKLTKTALAIRLRQKSLAQ